jgi:hypothetical protein
MDLHNWVHQHSRLDPNDPLAYAKLYAGLLGKVGPHLLKPYSPTIQHLIYDLDLRRQVLKENKFLWAFRGMHLDKPATTRKLTHARQRDWYVPYSLNPAAALWFTGHLFMDRAQPHASFEARKIHSADADFGADSESGMFQEAEIHVKPRALKKSMPLLWATWGTGETSWKAAGLSLNRIRAIKLAHLGLGFQMQEDQDYSYTFLPVGVSRLGVVLQSQITLRRVE